MSDYPIRIGFPTPQQVNVSTVMGHDAGLDDDLVALLDEAGLTFESSHVAEYVTAPGVDYNSLVRDTVTILGAAGGLGGIAAILKAFFARHKGISVKFGWGPIRQADGLSVDDIIRLLNTCAHVPAEAIEAASAEFEKMWAKAMRADEERKNLAKINEISKDTGDV